MQELDYKKCRNILTMQNASILKAVTALDHLSSHNQYREVEEKLRRKRKRDESDES